nr:hypothetical protein [Tanacetum cinerariifolium]
MSADSAVTYTFVHSEARSWSIPSEDPYEEAARQLLEQAPHSSEYVADPIELEDLVPLHIPEHPEDLMPAEDEAYILEVASTPTPLLPPSFLSLRTPPLLPIPLPVPSTSRRAEISKADTPPKKRLLLTAPRPGCEFGESSAAATRQPGPTTARSEDRAAVRAKIEVLRRERLAYEQESIQIREALTKYEAYSRTLEARVAKMAPKRTTRSTQVLLVTPAPTVTTTTVTEAQLQALINQGVAAAMAEVEVSRVKNGYDNNGLGPRLAQAIRECIYLDFLKCQPLNFKGTKGVVGLTQWFEKMKYVFNISNCIAACQVKYAVCTLQGVALTWWNSHVMTVTLEVAQALPWKTLKVEKYIGGLPDTIHYSVKATRPKTMQKAIEFATELMDRKICTFAERQTENKRKQDDNNNQAQQQPLKKQGVAIAYTVGPGERKEYAGTLPLCNKCKFYHNGQCTVKCVNCKRFGNLTRDCRSPTATNNHRNPTCYQCGNQGHYRSDCPELKNQDHVNQARGTGARGMVAFVHYRDALSVVIYLVQNHLRLSDKVYTLTGELLKKLALIVPSHRKFFIVELSDLAYTYSITLVDGNKSKGVESDGNQDNVTMWKLHESLEPLWHKLSECIGVTKSQLGQGSLSSVVNANVCDPPLPLGTQRRNNKYPRALLYASIAQDK